MQTLDSLLPVLIVGAGPTGLALACDLARRGIDFRIVDKSFDYFAGSRGKGLQPRTLEVLDDLGVIDRIVSCGRFHLAFRAYDGTTVQGDYDPHAGRHPTPSTPYASSLIIPQWRVEETLRGLLTSYGRHVELRSELISLEQDENCVAATVQTEGGQEVIRAQYLVASDGGRSFVRKFLAIGFEGTTVEDARLYVGDVRVDGLDRDHWHTWPKHPDGWLAMCPLPSTDSFQFQAEIRSTMDAEPSLENFQRIVDERTGRQDLKLHDATWLSLYRANIRMVDRYRVGRVFVAGDAAHVHPPIGGQGMNTGIQDAYNLGWKLGLVLHGAEASLLDTYEEERLPIAASVLGLTTRLSLQWRESKGQMPSREDTLQLGLNYRPSSLSSKDGTSMLTLEPGDRAPDSPLTNASGDSLRVFDLLRGPRFSLLSVGQTHEAGLTELGSRFAPVLAIHRISTGPDKQSLQSELLTEQEGHFSETYGLKDRALILIRPDGYIGWTGQGSNLDGATQYLNRFVAH
jgi:2-polyprenyl-6-methoxyphenol hydroxylase-like FAD-dependent oxidoreductase